MAPVFSLMTCVMLFLAVEHSVQAADSITVNESTLEDTLAKRGSSSGGGLGSVVTELVASVKSMKEDLQKTELKLQETEQILQKTRTDLQETKLQLEKKINAAQGSTFVRWGRKTCPASTTLVYSGLAGGKQYNQKGSGTNRLCLTRYPETDKRVFRPVQSPSYGYLYGAEYQSISLHQDHNVPCSVCRAPYSTTIMVAGTFTCPKGWTEQYVGLLTAANTNEYATEYVCLDYNPENEDNGGLKNENGLLFYPVLAVCGSLPCPRYTNNKVVTCAVCSR